jgi:hypothetical protein
MSRTATTAVFIVALGVAGCVAHGPGEVAYSIRDNSIGDTENVGATTSGGGGTVSGSARTDKGKDERGNTPPGMDRDGHGPAAGAIVDPTGAATRAKPY